jgi:catechol 2,3-dioxygenase-like lactoylglutathione lyase family enzyme
MRILELDHAQLCVDPAQLEAARVFYCEVLGLREIAKPESLIGRGGFWLQVGDRQVHVGIETGVDRLATKAHLAYRVDDLAAWREHLTAADCVIEESVPIPGIERFELRDPFGNRLELLQR